MLGLGSVHSLHLALLLPLIETFWEGPIPHARGR